MTMNSGNREEWSSLFAAMGKPKNVEVLRKIDIGYNSVVYLVSVEGTEYAVKIYNARYNGSNVCIQEKNNVVKARRHIPESVPNVLFCSQHTENGFDREILVMEKAAGTPLTKKIFDVQVFEELTSVLVRLHHSQLDSRAEIEEKERLHACRSLITSYLKRKEPAALERISNHLDALEKFYLQRKEIFSFRRAMIHGDLWWDNILVDKNEINIVDWLEASEQDYCRDLAQFKIGVLDEILDNHRSQAFLEKLLEVYREEFGDESIHERMGYHVPLMYLEESFYLPFKYFPWEIKYNEDPESFERRFVEYFEKSERFFGP